MKETNLNILKPLKSSFNYILMCKCSEYKETILNDIPEVFPSEDCLRGFVSGYGFGKIKVLTLNDYVKRENNPFITKETVFIKNVSIIEEGL